MSPIAVLVIAVLRATGMMSDPLLRSQHLNIAKFELANGYKTSHEHSVAHGVSVHALDSVVGFAPPEIIPVTYPTPTVDVAPGEQLIPTETVYDPTIESGDGTISNAIRDIPNYLNSLASDLIMGLVHTLLVMTYYTTFTPLHESIFEKAASEHPYAIYFWLSLAMLTLLESFLTFGWNYIHQEFHGSHEAAMKRLRRCEAKAWGQTILIKALGEAKDRFNLDLEALTASLDDAKTQISGIEKGILSVSRVFTQQDEDVKKMVRSFESVVRDQHSLREHVGELSTTLYKEQADHATCVDRFVHAYGSNVITLCHRLDCLQEKVNVLEREKLDRAAEIDTLKSAVRRADEERAVMIEFYRKQKFNNLHTNEFYQKAISETPEDQLAPAFMAYMTAMHSQMNATLQGVYRSAGGHPHTPQPNMPQGRQQNNGYGRPPNGPTGFGSPGLSSSRYGPPGGFPFNQRK
ncbi:hypothetical protein COCC4DRAFT_60614 [Bipolaris maydis ATCC 48331]|uniref:Uncharacterized protein n=2 Tax=Cochliobolus heterostrophus TaxID=5016 RepID=M2UL82_COCH5|nr:uncharacterized protein COCC4DRAFT_60614 [Bipolaris maydis ATCC 48331]EMD88722.1 hypothetical protein COCHEDRAFT_1110682 [Bipolaris maydis C5]KAJ5028698.1 hypothetical protein J3E73DRAFT_389346 [Bipolaris maydis]ENI05563.1 hypothetical protein COCC4DRAFT_60614 [Bipolaris maydis ATCC 48331]KAJ6205651.1 hypothetical protein PSV09DRAFT_1110682 [Bipolaris maydis]KAJ6272870.1 hypothetical protein PSV08DRAFT_175509 [Bipolaris maydis]